MTERSTSTIRGLVCAGLALTAIMVVATPASAQMQSDGNPGSPAQRRACTPDVYRLCAGEIPSVSKITACLRRKKASLSPGCAAVFEQ
jgi:hypothetical protein